MESKSDAQLLCDYAENGNESAFSEIVSRHTDLVYSTALRHVDSPDSARDIAQNAFTTLARSSRTLAQKLDGDASLAGWLCRCTRNIALNHRRDETRRRSRELQAMKHLDPGLGTDPDWSQLCLLLEDAMSGLSEADHDALVLRYFQNQDLRSVGRSLGLTDDTAQKRVSRALEKLKRHFARRGVTTSAAGIAAALSANAVQTAPVGLAASFASTALASAAITSASLTGCGAASAVLGLTIMTKLKTAAVILLIGGLATEVLVQNHAINHLRAQTANLETASHELDSLRAENEHLKSQAINAAELTRLRKAELELMRLRSERSPVRQTPQPAKPGLNTNTPPSNTADGSASFQRFEANVQAHVNGGETLAFGGWLAQNGKRHVFLLTPTSADGIADYANYELTTIEATDNALAAASLDYIREAGQETSGHKPLSHQELVSAIRNLEASPGVDILTAPKLFAKDGIPVSLSVCDPVPVPGSSETVDLGPAVKITAIRSADGASFDLTINAELNLPQK